MLTIALQAFVDDNFYYEVSPYLDQKRSPLASPLPARLARKEAQVENFTWISDKQLLNDFFIRLQMYL